jgi:Domain of unknown function (DUF4062)
MRSESSAPVLVDRASAAAVPPDADIRDFLSTERVFISSAMATLKEERAAVANAIKQLGAEAIWFEQFGGREADPEAAYLDEVRSSTIYVGILGARYGKILPSRFSATHTEYLAAEHGDLRISVWTVADESWDGHQQAFVQEVRSFHVTGSYAHAADLAEGVEQRLKRIAAEELSPWCKLGKLVFRAQRIVVSSNRLQVEAHVRDAEVADSLEAMRSRFGMGTELQFTDPSRSIRVRVQEVQSTARSGRGRGIEFSADIIEGSGGMGHDFSLQTQDRTFTPNDMTELALRQHLFGEINPADSGFASLPNPLDGFSPAVPEDAIRPILRLFVTETLVGSGRASRLVTLRLGVPVAGKRRILIVWRGSTQYGSPPEQRSIEGEVVL